MSRRNPSLNPSRKRTDKNTNVVIQRFNCSFWRCFSNRETNEWNTVISSIMDILPGNFESYDKSLLCNGLVDKDTFLTQMDKSDTIILTTNGKSKKPIGFFLLDLKNCERRLICGSGRGTGKSHVELGEKLLRDNGCRTVKLESLYTAIPFHATFGYRFDFDKIVKKLNVELGNILGNKIVMNRGRASAVNDRFHVDEVLPYIKVNRQNIIDDSLEFDDVDFSYDGNEGRAPNPVVLYIANVILNTNKLLLDEINIDRDELSRYITQVLGGLYPMYKIL